MCHLASAATRDTMSDTWSATDALGRLVPVAGDVRPQRTNRVVGIQYFLWMTSDPQNRIYDNTQIRAGDPERPHWGPPSAFHFWGQPQLGYYASDDPWVIRKHAQMLSDAGVDVLFVDVSNGFTFDDTFKALADTFEKIRAEGGTTPQIAFLANVNSAATITHEYETIYAARRYQDLWFQWQGKPLMLGPSDGLPAEITNFFTMRASWAYTARKGWFGDGHDRWPWLDNAPQKFGWHDVLNVAEEIPVAAAQYAITGIGRSFHDGGEPPFADRRPEAGFCFNEQWTRALAVDPPVVFVSGWNEWISPRYIKQQGGPPMMAGRALPIGGTFFVNEFSQEFSRDIEPMTGGHGDDYYYQLVTAVRQLKGVRPLPPTSPPKSIDVSGSFGQWNDVTPVYLDDLNDTEHRDHAGFDGGMRYMNDSGRNDLVEMRVARDAKNVYFYVQTREPITAPEGNDWMTLLISTKSQSEPERTNWQGYDLLINRSRTGDDRCSIERCTGGWNWRDAGTGTIRFEKNQLQLGIPRNLLNNANEPLAFDFKWTDHATGSSNAADFSDHGDVAPNGRFNYRYRE